MIERPSRLLRLHPLRRASFSLLLVGLLGLSCAEPDPLDEVLALHSAGRYRESIEPLRQMLDENPDDPELNYRYGVALWATRQDTLATWAFRKAMEDPDWLLAAGGQLAVSALANADYNVAIEVASEVLAAHPDNADLVNLRARAHAHWRNDPEAALRDAEEAMRLDPDKVEAMEPKILALLQLGKREEASAALDELGEWIEAIESPEQTRAWHCATSAIFVEENGDVARAREIWGDCLERFPGSSEVVWTAARFYDERGERDATIEVLRGGVEAEPLAVAYRVTLADHLRLGGQADEGEQVLLELAESEDDALAVEGGMALCTYRQNLGEYASAADAYEAAMRRAKDSGPPPPAMVFGYADALVLAGRLDRALEVADEQLTVRAHKHAIRARVHQERGEYAAALDEFDEAFRLWPDNPWARYYAALAAEQLGQFHRAVEEYRTSIRIDAGATDSRTRLASLLLTENRVRAASQVLRPIAKKPLDRVGMLLALRVAGLQGDIDGIEQKFKTLAQHYPDSLAAGVAAAVDGVATVAGPETGLELMRVAESIDLDDPDDAGALVLLVRLHQQAGQGEALPAELASALAARPDAAVFQEILGLHWELAGRGDRARAAYEQALELQPGQGGALLGLARLALPSDPERALELYEAAGAAGVNDPEARLGAAQAFAALGRHDEAAQQYEAQLRATPTNASAAAMAAQHDVERDAVSQRTLERALRAVRAGGGPDALELVSRVHAALGNEEQAAQASERAQAMRAALEQRGEVGEAGEAPATAGG